jgi:hypothetical protein
MMCAVPYGRFGKPDDRGQEGSAAIISADLESEPRFGALIPLRYRSLRERPLLALAPSGTNWYDGGQTPEQRNRDTQAFVGMEILRVDRGFAVRKYVSRFPKEKPGEALIDWEERELMKKAKKLGVSTRPLLKKVR